MLRGDATSSVMMGREFSARISSPRHNVIAGGGSCTLGRCGGCIEKLEATLRWLVEVFLFWWAVVLVGRSMVSRLGRILSFLIDLAEISGESRSRLHLPTVTSTTVTSTVSSHNWRP